MRFGGVLPEDAPDPRVRWAEKLAAMPVPVWGLVSQPSLDDGNLESFQSNDGSDGMTRMDVSLSYTLWRNPADRSDPVNLAELDESMRRSLDEVPPWPRPAWLVEQVERMRYPLLWEAVRTSWFRRPSELTEPRRLLVEHTNHVLMNRYRDELGLGDIRSDRFAARLTERAVDDRATVPVRGVETGAIRIDTDPFVFAIGFEVDAHTVVTAVVPRDELDHVRVEFDLRQASAPTPPAA